MELAPGVRVNGIAPGVVETDALKEALTDELRTRIVSATPLHRLSTVADVANAARWLASPAASYVTGKIIEIDGGAEAPVFPDDTPDLRPANKRRTVRGHFGEQARASIGRPSGNSSAGLRCPTIIALPAR